MLPEEINKLYLKYKPYIDALFGIDFLEDDCGDRRYYVYTWYTKTTPPKYFYVGKGAGSRWKHIENDIKKYDSSNKSNDRLRRLSMINHKYNIACKKIFSDLTEKQALIAEECIKRDFTSRGEVLLNQENWVVGGDTGLYEMTDSGIIKDAFWEHYIQHVDLSLDSVDESVFRKVIFYPYHIEKTEEQKNIERKIANYTKAKGGKVLLSGKSNSYVGKTILFWPGQLYEERFAKMREEGAKICDASDVEKYIEERADVKDEILNSGPDDKELAYLTKKQNAADYLKELIVAAGIKEEAITESKYKEHVQFSVHGRYILSLLCYKKKPGGVVSIPLDYAKNMNKLFSRTNSWEGKVEFVELSELDAIKPFIIDLYTNAALSRITGRIN